MDIQARIAANRRKLADFFETLDDQQLETRSLCEAWSVREVLGHLVMPLTGSVGGFAWHLVKARGSLDRASVQMAQELSQRPLLELTSLLRDHADEQVRAPGVGPMGQMADGCVHLRDCARPLGLSDDVSLKDWRVLLEWLPNGVPGLVPKRRLEGLRLLAADQPFSWGSGAEVSGPSEALAMALAGRSVALNDLRGSGVKILRGRLAAA